MDCLKSQNQCVNTVMFPGSLAPSSYHPESYAHSYNLRLIYIPFKRLECQCAYLYSAPTHIPALLALNPSPSTNLFCIHFHGNACDVGQISICAQREGHAFNAHYLLVEYPGFGFSKGYCNEVIMDEIAICVHQFITETFMVPHSQIVLIGRSIGTGPACSLASHLTETGKPPLAVVLQSPFASIRDAASDLLGCVSVCVLDRWPNWRRLVGNDRDVIRCPVLFIHADHDKIIRINHSEILHQHRLQCGLPSEMFVQRSTEKMLKGHNFFDYVNDVVEPTKAFLLQKVAERNQGQGPAMQLLKLPHQALERALITPIEYVQPNPDTLTEDEQAKHKAKQSKCDNWVKLAWACCPCLFCAEASCACAVTFVTELCILTSLYKPAVNYKQLRPKELAGGSLFNLMTRKKSFERMQAEEDMARSAKKTEVVNPLNAKNAPTRVPTKEEDLPTAAIIRDPATGAMTDEYGFDYIPG